MKKDTESAEIIYGLYPRKVARPIALKAIEKALKNYPFEFLLERTRKYANLRKDTLDDIPSVPNPSTWFNQERFNDDPSTWEARTAGLGRTIRREKAPTGPAYKRFDRPPDLTDEQIAKNKAVIAEHVGKLHEKFKPQ